METKKQSRKNIIIGILVLLLGLSITYICYDKLMNKNNEYDECKNTNLTNDKQECGKDPNLKNEDDGIEELKKIIFFGEVGFDKLGIEIYFENNYLKYLPIHFEKNKISSYKIEDLTDEEISKTVWLYLVFEEYYDYYDGKVPSSIVEKFIESRFNLKKYNVKDIGEKVVPGTLKKEGNTYAITIIPTDIAVPKYRVNDIKYNSITKELFVYFDMYYSDVGIYKVKSGVSTYQVNINGYDSNYYLTSVEFYK